MVTVIAVACLAAVVLTQGVIAYFLVRSSKDSKTTRKVIRTRV